MISKAQFSDIIIANQKQSKQLDELKDLGFDLWETSVSEFGFQMFDKLIETNFCEEGRDWIFWWLYERDSILGDVNKAWDENGKEIPTETIDDLWNLVEKYRV